MGCYFPRCWKRFNRSDDFVFQWLKCIFVAWVLNVYKCCLTKEGHPERGNMTKEQLFLTPLSTHEIPVGKGFCLKGRQNDVGWIRMIIKTYLFYITKNCYEYPDTYLKFRIWYLMFRIIKCIERKHETNVRWKFSSWYGLYGPWNAIFSFLKRKGANI